MSAQRAQWILVALGVLAAAVVIARQAAWVPSVYLQGASTVSVTQSQDATTEKSRYAVNVNTATLEELLGVKYITPETAQNIVDYRTENGRFYDESELLAVPGIGEKTLERIRPYIKIG